jgi:hypothetical protein
MARVDTPLELEFTEPGLWPTAPQEALLRAALWDGEAAIEAWNLWSTNVDIQEYFDPDSFNLLPLLYQNTIGIGVPGPLRRRLKGVYRRAWVESNQLIQCMRPLLQKFHDQGITTLLLKGAPLAFAYYGSPATRSLTDLGVLVHPNHARQAVAVVESAGWQRYSPAKEGDIRYLPGIRYHNATGQNLMLHWQLMPEYCHPLADDLLWGSCVPFEFEGIPTHRLDTTHTLLYTVVGGVRWNPASGDVPAAIQWIADAVTLIKADGARIDWEQVMCFARKNNTTYRLRLGLRYLNERMHAPIPPDFMRTLMNARPTWLERIENPCILRDPEPIRKKPMGWLWIFLVEYCRITHCRPTLGRWMGWQSYLRYRMYPRRRREILKVALRGIRRRVRRWFGRSPADAIAANSSTK